MAWFLVILGKDGEDKEGKNREEKGEMPLILPPGETHKEREVQTGEQRKEREQRDKGERKGGRLDKAGGLCSGLWD